MYRQTIKFSIGESFYQYQIVSESDQLNLADWNITLPEGQVYDFLVEDITNEMAEEALKVQIAQERKNMESGIEILAYFNVLTNLNNYGINEFESLLSNSSINMAKELLRSGAIETSYAFISDIPTDAVFTQQFKSDILSKIESYIQS